MDETARARLAALAPGVSPHPWGEFFAASSFEKPLQKDAASKRASVNSKKYAHNYLVLTAGCILFALLTSPITAALVFVGLAAAAAYRLDYRGVAASVDARAAGVGLFVYSLVVASVTSLVPVVTLGAACGAVACGVHAVTHEPPETFGET
jgi:PRA1 family protein